MMRVIAVDARGGEVLDWEVPVLEASLTRSLNAPCMVSVTVPAWYHARVDQQGHPVLLRHGTILVVEEDDGRSTPALIKGESLEDDFKADGLGLSTIAEGVPWERERSEWSNHDVLSMWRYIMGWIIQGSGIPRMKVTGETSAGVVIGSTSTAKWRQTVADLNEAQETISRRDNRTEYWDRELVKQAKKLASYANKKSIGEVTSSSEVPESGDGASHKMHIYTSSEEGKGALRVYYWRWDGEGFGEWYYRTGAGVRQAADRYLAIKNTRDNSKNWFSEYATYIEEKQEWLDNNEDQGPEHYELSRWANRDLSDDLEVLRDLGGFDWFEAAEWDDDDNLVPIIRVVNDAGAYRQDLYFELGVNIHTHPELTRGDIVTHVSVTGAGEGESTLQADRAWSHPRMVRVSGSLSESDLSTRQLVARAADREIAKGKAGMDWRFTSLTVTESKAAPLRSLNLGDRIDIRGTLSDGSDLNQRVRVVEITRSWDGDDPGSSIEIEVEPA